MMSHDTSAAAAAALAVAVADGHGVAVADVVGAAVTGAVAAVVAADVAAVGAAAAGTVAAGAAVLVVPAAVVAARPCRAARPCWPGCPPGRPPRWVACSWWEPPRWPPWQSLPPRSPRCWPCRTGSRPDEQGQADSDHHRHHARDRDQSSPRSSGSPSFWVGDVGPLSPSGFRSRPITEDLATPHLRPNRHTSLRNFPDIVQPGQGRGEIDTNSRRTRSAREPQL